MLVYLYVDISGVYGLSISLNATANIQHQNAFVKYFDKYFYTEG